MSSIDKIVLVEGTRDRVLWALSSFGRFICSSFRRSLARVGVVFDRWKLLWDLPVPIKVVFWLAVT